MSQYWCEALLAEKTFRWLIALTCIFAIGSLISGRQYYQVYQQTVYSVKSATVLSRADPREHISAPHGTDMTSLNTGLDLYSNRNTSSCVKEVCNLYFVKVHKTGSTTLQNIIYRFGLKRNLLFALFRCGNGMPFPNPAYSKYLVEDPLHSHFNIVCEHARYEDSAMMSYMDRRVVISLLRHPLDFLKSTISFHNLIGKMGLHGAKDQDFVADFLHHPAQSDAFVKFIGSSAECGPFRAPSYTRNAMAYHFGLVNQSESRGSVIWQFVEDVEKKMRMVLILERFDESLVLLKRAMTWNMEDILYLPLWSLRFHGRQDIIRYRDENETKMLIEKHKHWSPADYTLYNYFSTKLTTILDKQDGQFWQEVRHFKHILSQLRTFCHNMCYIDMAALKLYNSVDARGYLSRRTLLLHASQWNQQITVTYLDCVTMMLTTLDYQAAIRSKQKPKKCPANSAVCPSDDLVYSIPWAKVKYTIFSSSFTCARYFQ